MANLTVVIIPNFFETLMEVKDKDTGKRITFTQSEIQSLNYVTSGYGEFPHSYWNKNIDGTINVIRKLDDRQSLSFTMDDIVYAKR